MPALTNESELRITKEAREGSRVVVVCKAAARADGSLRRQVDSHARAIFEKGRNRKDEAASVWIGRQCKG